MDALIMKPFWANGIMFYGKDWELRSRDTCKRGPIAIVSSGDHVIHGFANLYGTKRLTKSMFENGFRHHLIKAPSFESLPKNYQNGYAYYLKGIVPCICNYKYEPRHGAVIWLTGIEDLVTSNKEGFLHEMNEYLEKQKGDADECPKISECRP